MDKNIIFSSIPKVDEILNRNDIIELLQRHPRITVVDSIRKQINNIRNYISNSPEDDLIDFSINIDEIVNKVRKEVDKANEMKLRRVINATGVVLHTNLGRALISDDVKEKILEVACNYSTLEFDLSNGKRGSRYSHVEEIICKLTGAESALVVNNNAAAVLLVLNTLAKEKEVIVSRGQLVEIGGSFRVPDVMAQSGAKLVEVGTTNKTHLYDYENNINEETAAILKVHSSNYKILGFSKSVEVEELSSVCKKHNLPLIEDIGSGTLIDFSKYGFTYEPTVLESLNKGVDIVTFSGDKLLGGPQAGIIVGKKEYIDKMKKNQLTRALRVDKMTLVCLEATLRLYLDETEAIKKIPTLKMLTMNIDEINENASELSKKLQSIAKNISIELIDGYSQVGGGSMPLEKIPTKLISLSSNYITANEIERYLRNNEIPIISRIQEDRVLLDVRTIKSDEFEIIVKAINDIESRVINE